ncbi:PAS domain S-box protein [Sideroxydans lithotrophicus]|uniref:Diguanylate cyclase/phosphodiesterase with PAS/PAC sensor(S) n=1 Tax=Sideroxydans lithotrophicus (strain ES-1) TaxID=580332 RepID=D5CN45_SIDLE|nr:EAL domain-containing protein [Sideroxydans lithotrophicus]ADE12742.1 diguanylate cyclase/phosphodiesterase with PAS/PAC sensor(s) [Sideroxydans lithotrophicus ES-1]
MNKRLTPARIALLYAAFAALWIFASDKLLVLAVRDPELIVQISTYKGLIFVFVTTWLLYLLMQSWIIQTVRTSLPETAANDAHNVHTLFAIFLCLVLIVPLFGFGIARLYGPRIQQVAFADLASIAELKTNQIEIWLKEWRDDAEEFSQREGFSENVEQWFKHGDKNAKHYVLGRMDTLADMQGYDPVLLDTHGKPGLAADFVSDPIAEKVWLDLLKSALLSSRPQHSDLYRDSNGAIRLDFVVPLYLPNPQRLVGAIVLRAPVNKLFFPLIQSWPTSSSSAETVLVRQEGDQILFLNELRHQKNTALTLRFPIDHSGMPAAASIKSKTPQTLEGVDYRGIRVLAATRPIPGTDWHLVAKVDRDEVMALPNEMIFWLGLVAILIVFVVTSAVMLIWRQQQRLHRMELANRSSEQDKQLKLFYDLPFIGMAITSPATKRWVYANDRLCDMLGYSRDDLLKTAWIDLTHPDDVAGNLKEFERMVAGETDGFNIEKRFIRKDGSPITVNLDVKCTRRADGKPDLIVALVDDITQRKQTELALRAKEATYRSLFDNMLNGVAHYRMIFRDGAPVDYEFIAVNPAFGKTTGLKDVVGRKVSEVIPGYCEANQDSLQVFGKVAQTGEACHWEHYLSALGKWFSFSIYSPAPGEFVVVSEDITERKQAETALRDSEDRFRSIFNNAIDGILLADSGTRKFIMGNSAIARMLGYSNEELLQLGTEDIHPEQDKEYYIAQFAMMVRGESTLSSNAVVKRKDGSVFYADIKASPLRIGDKVYLMGFFRDITERKQTEDALRQGAAVFESSHNGIIITDLDGHILAANQAYADISGYTESELLGQNPRILNSGRQSRDFYRKMWANIKEAGSWQGELWNRRKNGEIYPTWLAVSAVRNDQGKATHYVGISSDLSQLRQTEAEREHLAHYDPLTDLPNRLLLRSHLTHALAQAKRHHNQVGVLYLDLDRFKNINDSLGYQVGDELLVTLTERLTMHMRSEDLLARLGGDEFLLVLEHINEPEDSAIVARSLLETLAQPFVLHGEREIFIGASIGISIFPNDGDSAEQLIQHADAAMHQAKTLGRNTYHFYTEDLSRASNEHLELENRLRHAITANQLRVYYQPQVDIATGHIIGAEALVRWQDPERGLVQPGQFIPLAEETGLIGAIGEWVLKETCLQGMRWIDAGLPFLTLAVNLSPHQFLRGNIAGLISKVLAETGFPADRLELELTESALMQQGEDVIKMLHLLRAQDIRLAIDDFGTGYSSLSYLKRFPLDILKIDKSFVDDIPFHQDDMEIAATIIAMGHILGFKVLAEGVETREQLEFLQARGCDLYQGYLTSPPIPAEEFEKLLKENMARDA